jgi:hypothetical protein
MAPLGTYARRMASAATHTESGQPLGTATAAPDAVSQDYLAAFDEQDGQGHEALLGGGVGAGLKEAPGGAAAASLLLNCFQPR